MTRPFMDESEQSDSIHLVKLIAEMQGISTEVAERFLKSAGRFKNSEVEENDRENSLSD